MKNTIIFGSGQAGQMYFRLLNPASYKILAFADNNPLLHTKKLYDLEILSASDAKEMNPDLFFIALNNLDASKNIKQQLIDLEVEEEKILIADYRTHFDIRLATTKLISEEIIKRKISGAIAELGVFQGAFASQLNRLFPDRNLYLYDTFEGFDERDITAEALNNFSKASISDFSQTGVDLVLSILPFPNKAIIRKGYFPETAKDLDEKFALVSLDPDLYLPTYEGLKFFYPRMSQGGMIIIHDYNNTRFNGVKEAVSTYCNENNLFIVPLCDLHGTAVLMKS
ncbi:TylF/MycF/NovP-related O-methyltransferase [Anaerovorax odorimutans]|uniref:TylF/MycF/NovP-related O-methyltransferase n=1 Tax=Anaerovorax odorimutans TaxID=109327 RepID=UPI0004221194|nr:TylF/MycF/NovP-related O-methyltransferase [Anaerovorax odorimutans]